MLVDNVRQRPVENSLVAAEERHANAHGTASSCIDATLASQHATSLSQRRSSCSAATYCSLHPGITTSLFGVYVTPVWETHMFGQAFLLIKRSDLLPSSVSMFGRIRHRGNFTAELIYSGSNERRHNVCIQRSENELREQGIASRSSWSRCISRGVPQGARTLGNTWQCVET